MKNFLRTAMSIICLTCLISIPAYSQPKIEFKFSNKDKAVAHYNIAINFAKRGELEKAIKEFSISRDLDPGNFDVYYNLGVAYAKLGKPEFATEAYKKALELKPEDVFTYYNLAVVLTGVKKYDEAEENYLKAIQYKDDLVEARANLAMIYLYKGDKEKYQQQITALEKIDPKTAEMVKQAATPSKQGAPSGTTAEESTSEDN